MHNFMDEFWREVVAALLTANLALVGVIYKGVMRRLDRTDLILARMAGGFIALATTLAPDRAPTIIRDFVDGLMKPDA